MALEAKSFNIIVMNSVTKAVVRTETVNGWFKATERINEIMNKLSADGWKTQVKGTYDVPRYIKSPYKGCTLTTSFSALKWNTCKEDSQIIFGYIKKV